MKKLSKREHQILKGYKNGMKNRDIAEEIGIGQKTVGTYVARAKSKLGLSPDDNVYITVVTAIERGLI